MTSDYIAPGEFSFCGRCGAPDSCHFGPKSVTCDWCMPQDRKPLDCALDGDERDIVDDAKRAQGKIAYKCRSRIAELRRAAGLKPIWWMKEKTA